MTVLVGLLCKDGIVIGTDSAATFSAGQSRTIEQTTQKIDIIGDRVIVAGTGQIGLGQRFTAVVRKAWDEKLFRDNDIDIAKTLCAKGIEDFSSTHAPMGQFGCLVAYPTGNKANLCEFAISDFQPELKTDRLWYVSMGSGQPICDPFLGLMRKVFWKDGLPTHQDGIFAVTWAIQHAIELNPGGINGPVQIAVLSTTKGELRARLLTDAELSEHINNVDAAITHLGDYANILRGKGPQNTPDIPKP